MHALRTPKKPLLKAEDLAYHSRHSTVSPIKSTRTTRSSGLTPEEWQSIQPIENKNAPPRTPRRKRARPDGQRLEWTHEDEHLALATFSEYSLKHIIPYTYEYHNPCLRRFERLDAYLDPRDSNSWRNNSEIHKENMSISKKTEVIKFNQRDEKGGIHPVPMGACSPGMTTLVGRDDVVLLAEETNRHVVNIRWPGCSEEYKFDIFKLYNSDEVTHFVQQPSAKDITRGMLACLLRYLYEKFFWGIGADFTTKPECTEFYWTIGEGDMKIEQLILHNLEFKSRIWQVGFFVEAKVSIGALSEIVMATQFT